MHFIYPSFLWALAALAIPILVHLFNFRKAKLVRFSNVKFLEAIKKKSASTRNIKHILILASRLLFLLFLIIAFAQPFIPGTKNGLNSPQVDIFIDNSSSMSNLTTENVSGLTMGVQLAENILNLYSNDTKFRVLTNGFEPSSNNYRSKENALNSILELNYSSVQRDGDEILDRLVRKTPSGNDIFIISDFQKSTVGQISAKVDTANMYHLLPITFTDYSNLLVDSVYLKTPFVIAGQRNQLMVNIQNPTSQASKETIVKLHLNGRQSGSVSVDLEPNSFEILEFELDNNLQEINTGVVSIEDYPMTFDNDYFFSFKIVQNIRIVEITEDDVETEINKVFQDNNLFAFQNFERGNISYRQVKNADLLIINALSSIENGLKSQIKSLLAAGKSVVFIPSKDGDPEDYSEGLGVFLSKTENVDRMALETPNVNHPFFENIFDEVVNSSSQPSAELIWKWQAADNPILASKTGSKFLSQIISKGNLFLFSSPLNLESTDFTRNALFVPVLHRMAEKSSAANQQLAYELNRSVIQIQLDSLTQNDLYKLKREQDEIIPNQKANGNTLLLDLPTFLMSPGFYDLELSGNASTSLAFNHVRTESQLEILSIPEIEEKFKNFSNKEVYVSRQLDNFSKIMKDKYHRMELWKYALILSLVFLVAETLLIRYL
ncbi:MAG: BatA domain-containing protein [Reichenbachiella sp.]